MKKTLMKLVMLTSLLTTLMLSSGCNRIEPGYVGIKVNQAGSSKGVEDYPLQTGWVFYFPLTTRVYEYPTFQQTVVWGGDESISFNCKGGAAISADVSTSGRFVTDKVPQIFVKFRSEPSTIVHTYLRNEFRDSLSRVASTYDPMDIIGDQRSQFLDAVKKEVDKRVGDWWVTDYVTFANKLRMDGGIEQSINQIIQQKQQTQTSELKVKQKQAEADQKVAEAEGEARSRQKQAEGEAAAILKKAEAQAKANQLIAQSLAQNPLVLQSIALEKWDGKLPYVNGSGTIPFITLTNR